MNKPREFWIDENWAIGACDEMHLCVYDKEVDGIHVIEKSAYDELRSELDVLKADYGNCDAERDSRRFENASLKSRLESSLKKIDELESDVEQYERASEAQSRQWESLRKSYTDALKMLEEMAGALDEYNSGHVAGPGTARKALDNYRKWKEGMK